MIAMFAVTLIVENKIKKSDFAWASHFLWFLGAVVLGLIFSPYGMMPWEKGLFQLVGILMMIMVAAYILRYVKNNPQRLVSLLRFFLVVLGSYSAIGIAQFLLGTLTPFSLSFDFLNTLAGGSGVEAQVWRDGGYMGPFKRANSLGAEPTAFATYLCVGLGLSLVRLGLLGRHCQSISANLVPHWAAYSIVIGMMVTFSINSWLMFMVVLCSLFIVSSRISLAMLLKVAAGLTFLLLILFLAASLSGEQFSDKFASLALITLDAEVGTDVATEQVSALAMASNLEVTYQNFTNHPVLGGGVGSHPIAYKIFVPGYMSASKIDISGLNADDAASLVFRLLSETGVVGFVIFIFGLASVIYRARKAILFDIETGTLSLYRVIAIGITASSIGLMGTYLTRLGRYYDPIFWLAIALTVCATYCLSNGEKLPGDSRKGI